MLKQQNRKKNRNKETVTDDDKSVKSYEDEYKALHFFMFRPAQRKYVGCINLY